MITAAFLIAILFLGGWHFWGLTDGVDARRPRGDLAGRHRSRDLVLAGKVLAMILFFMLARWSWPRFRLRPVDGHRLEGDAAVGRGQFGGRGGVRGIWSPAGRRLGPFAPRSSPRCAAGRRCVAAWAITTLVDPTVTDNRPRRHPSEYATGE